MNQLSNSTVCVQRIGTTLGSRFNTPFIPDASSCVTFADDVVWCFTLNAVWEFVPTNGEWYQLQTTLPAAVGDGQCNVASIMPNGTDILVLQGGTTNFYTISRSTLKHTYRGSITDLFSRADHIMWKNATEVYVHRSARLYTINITTWAANYVTNPGIPILSGMTKLLSGNYLFVGGSDTNVTLEFAVSNGTLITKAPFPLTTSTDAAQSQVEYLNGLYVFGGVQSGYLGTTTIYRYNISANTWALVNATGIAVPTAGYQFVLQYSEGRIMFTTGVPWPYDSTNTSDIVRYNQS